MSHNHVSLHSYAVQCTQHSTLYSAHNTHNIAAHASVVSSTVNTTVTISMSEAEAQLEAEAEEECEYDVPQIKQALKVRYCPSKFSGVYMSC